MAYVDQSSNFGYGVELSSIQMQNLRDNLDAAFAGDGGAPELAQGGLKTSVGELAAYNNFCDDYTNVVTVVALLPGGEYGFVPQTKYEQCSWGFGPLKGGDGNLSFVNSSTYQSLMSLSVSQNSHGSPQVNSISAWAQQRYVTSSGEVFWIFLLRDKETKNITASWASPDHPCFGNSNDPNKIQHPFGNFDSNKYEILVINPTTKEIEKIEDLRNYVYGMPQKSFMSAIWDYYKIDEIADVKWPKKKVTVGLNRERTASIKTEIPKPDYIKQAKLIKK